MDIASQADAMLVVIGPNWLDSRNIDGVRRLDDPDDFVRREIALALNGNAVVIPVLVGGAVMPVEADLPAELAGLARRNSLTLSDADWGAGEARLVEALERLFLPEPEASAAPVAQPARARRSRPWWRRLARRPKPAARPKPAGSLSAAELAEKRATGRAEPAGDLDAAASLGQDIVDCTVFAPASVVPGDAAFVQVFAHLLEQAEEARSLAEEFDSAARPRAFRTLEAAVRRGSRLTFDLDFRHLTVADPVQSLIWNGKSASVQFSVETPEDARPGTNIGTVSVSLESVPIGHVKFKLDIVSPEEQRAEHPEPVGDDARRYKTAFVSYSSKDRQAVLERVQMLKPLGIEFFRTCSTSTLGIGGNGSSTWASTGATSSCSSGRAMRRNHLGFATRRNTPSTARARTSSPRPRFGR